MPLYSETSIRWPSLTIGAALVAAAAADFLIPLDSPGDDIARPLALAAPGMLLLLWSLTRRRVRIDSRRLRLGRRSIELADLDPASVAKARSEATWSDEQRRRAHAPAPSADQITEMVNDLAACREELLRTAARRADAAQAAAEEIIRRAGNDPARREAAKDEATRLLQEHQADMAATLDRVEAEVGTIRFVQNYYDRPGRLSSVFLARKDSTPLLVYTRDVDRFTTVLREAVSNAPRSGR